MGLDMYLAAKIHVNGYNHAGEESQAQFRALLDLAGLGKAADPQSPFATISITVAYWRKANAIHQWFVDNVQEGKDDCGEYWVSREQLEELRATCRRVMEVAQIEDGQPVHAGTSFSAKGVEQHFVAGRAIMNGEEVAKILPTQGGFFFGSTDYDEWYIRDVERTIERLGIVLDATADMSLDFEYHSSW